MSEGIEDYVDQLIGEKEHLLEENERLKAELADAERKAEDMFHDALAAHSKNVKARALLERWVEIAKAHGLGVKDTLDFLRSK